MIRLLVAGSFRTVATLAIALLGGCTTYHSQPLTADAVSGALQPPELEAVRVAAGAIQHPLLPPVTIDGRDGFTPDELAIIAVIASPRLRAVRDQRGLANAQVIEAGVLPNPQFDLSFDQPHGNSDPTLVTGQAIGLAWELSSLIGRSDRIQSAKRTVESLDLSIAWEEWQVAQEVRLRAYRVLALEKSLGLLRILEPDAESMVALKQEALSRGVVLSADLTNATALWTGVQSDRLQVEKDLVDDRAALRLALGQPPDAVLTIKPVASPEWPEVDATADALLDGLEQRRFDLVALAIGYASEEAALRSAVRAQFPAIGLSVNRTKDTSNVRSRGLGVTISLPLFDRNQGAIAAGEATRKQLFDEYVFRVAEARSSAAQILEQLALVREQSAAVTKSLPALDAQSAAAEKAAAGGLLDVVASYDARAAFAIRQIEQIRLSQEAFELTVALEIATGRTPTS